MSSSTLRTPLVTNFCRLLRNKSHSPGLIDLPRTFSMVTSPDCWMEISRLTRHPCFKGSGGWESLRKIISLRPNKQTFRPSRWPMDGMTQRPLPHRPACSHIQNLTRGKAGFEPVREMPLGNAATGRRSEHETRELFQQADFRGARSKGLMASTRKWFGSDEEHATEQIYVFVQHQARGGTDP